MRAGLDVLIVTAIREEYAAVRAVDTGALPGSTWEPHTAPSGIEYRVRPFSTRDGGVLRVGVTQALSMGSVAAVVGASAQLVTMNQVRCLAMCGVCAGRRGDVALGDVIIADRMWAYDEGKLVARVDEAGRRVEEEQGDIQMYRVEPPAWKLAAERFAIDPASRWLATRPRSQEAQGDWVLERVLHGVDPAKDPEREVKCADFDVVLEHLWKKKLLRDGALELTKAGKNRIERALLLNRGKLPAPPAFRTHVGPMASGNRVVVDPAIFDKLSTAVRKVIGLEMEAAAIGGMGWAHGIEHVVVMKGVMDHADGEKDDRFKPFAARASAECLLQFLRENLPAVGKIEDPILARETSPLPKKFGPAALLNARHGVVDFVGREARLQALQKWCEQEGRVDAKLIHATGGMGKTRLAMELCGRMRDVPDGWRVGFVPQGLGVDSFAELVRSDEPVLAVIDYAEGRGQLREMLQLAAARRGEERGKTKLRILLLARNAEDWWAELRSADGAVKDLLCEDPIRLEAVDADREAVFQQAVKGFAEKLGKTAAEGKAPSLVDPRYERVLYVQMAALAAVEADGEKIEAERLMEDTLDHEERFWLEQLRERGRAGERIARSKMRRAVAGLTLLGGVSSASELHALVEDEEMELLLRDLYPGGGAAYVSGLEPDLLGEAMVWRALSKEGAGAEAYLDRVFQGATEKGLRTGFAVLGRMSEERKEAEGWIAHVLGRDVEGRAVAAFAAAKMVAERTAHAELGRELATALARKGTVEVGKQLAKNLPHPEQTVSLREVGLWVLETLVQDARDGSDEIRAGLLNNFGLWQNALNRTEAALASTQEAVALYRRLAAARPEAFSHGLAVSLNNLGKMQSALGQRTAGLASTLEAVFIYRSLAKARPEALLPVLPDLALSLNNLSAMQEMAGQRQAALSSTEEAVKIFRRLAKTEPERFQPELAMSLNNLGATQSMLGQREAALISTAEATTIYRRLAELKPDAYQPGLAGTLNNLGVTEKEIGRAEAALSSFLEGVAIYRRLAEARPDAFMPDLAKNLTNLGAIQGMLGQLEAALTSTLEAVALRRKLAEVRPDAFLRDLGTSLNNLGTTQALLGQKEAALASTLEAVALRRRLVEVHPEAFLPDLASSLNNLGARQSTLGQLDAALASTQEAVALYRRLAEATPDKFGPELAKSLNNLASGFQETGKVADALECAQEAVDILWPAYERYPTLYGDIMGPVLRTVANLLKALGQHPDKLWTQRMTRYLAISSS
jgi:tetratricopeptide (TPR) repeat protein/nucleoside phosphorylase